MAHLVSAIKFFNTFDGVSPIVQKLETVQEFFYNVLGGNWAQYLPSAFANVGECLAARVPLSCIISALVPQCRMSMVSARMC